MDRYPPGDVGEWRNLSKVEKVADQTIHDMDLNSASKLKISQYLMLRVLWKAKDKNFFKPANFGLAEWVERASRQLEEYGSWKSYRASFSGALSEGTFALARFYQKQVSWVPEDVSFNSHVATVPSPISKHTRSRSRRLEEWLRQATLETPSKTPKDPPEAPKTPSTNVSSDSGSEEDDSPDVPYSSGPPELLDLNFPKTKDEQIVNTALLDFLNAFIVHRSLPVQWSLYRKPFIADFAKASVQARTDGCLEEVRSEKVHAIVEVKPIVRAKARFSIPMQEAAQMVAWIKTNPDPAESVGGCGCRLHVSQDRNEIYIIFAEYNEDYVKYLDNRLGPSDEPGFLTMHQFGPWDTENESDMAEIGKVLLAIALRANGACQGR